MRDGPPCGSHRGPGDPHDARIAARRWLAARVSHVIEATNDADAGGGTGAQTRTVSRGCNKESDANNSGSPSSARVLKKAIVQKGGWPCESKKVFNGLHGLSLHAALGQTARLKYLLCRNPAADPNARDSDGDRVPLHWAAARGQHEAARLLLAARADPLMPNATGETPLQLAGNEQISHLLRAHLPLGEETVQVSVGDSDEPTFVVEVP